MNRKWQQFFPRRACGALALTACALTGKAAAAPAELRPLQGLTAEQARAFAAGAAVFQAEWVAGGEGKRDGLGPFFHAASCLACHPAGGRAMPVPDGAAVPGLLFRIGTPEEAETDDCGAQLAPAALPGLKPEGRIAVQWTERSGTYADGALWTLREPVYSAAEWNYGERPDDLRISPRIAPALYGGGLLEALTAAAIGAGQDPDDRNGDGISGRVNREETWEGYDATVRVTGRFGWKAWMPTLMRQVCGALGEDMGVTNVFAPHDHTPAQFDAVEHYPSGGNGNAGHEVNPRDLRALVAFSKYLAPPEPRPEALTETAQRGAAVFTALQCTACHTPEWKTGTVRGEPALSGQTLRPFTDLLLHDMGDALADDRPEAEASGREWRTAPLWGLGRGLDSEGRGLLLHDGRARTPEEAVLWHGGEAQGARDRFLATPAEDRAALLAWLRAL